MMASWSGKTLTTFLALSVFAGSVAPPAYAHVHPDGHESHDHHGEAGDVEHHDHAHRHDDEHQHHHHAPANPVRHSSSDDHNGERHWHVSLFFFDLTLPTLPAQDGEEDSSDKSPAVARLVDLSRAFVIDIATDSWLDGIASAVAVPQADLVADHPAWRPSPPPARNLLCDTARRERSGVLLT